VVGSIDVSFYVLLSDLEIILHHMANRVPSWRSVNLSLRIDKQFVGRRFTVIRLTLLLAAQIGSRSGCKLFEAS
jgi:hypothetical protein